MGNERFYRSSYASYSTDNKLKSARREEVFVNRKIPQSLDPSKIPLRESCDSAANPQSTPVIIGLDVTGSMGFVAETIAKDLLPDLMERIYEEKPITDPHLMFMGIGDVTCDQAPLQVSQFEAGAIPLIEQLRQLYLEQGGGGNHYESYDLPWYFAAHRTSIDSFNKRSQKGYIFTIGDELPPQENLRSHDLKRVFGAGQFPDVGSTKQLLTLVGERYKVFHIIAEEGDYARSHSSSVKNAWVNLLGPNAINMRNHRYLPEIVVATLRIANGEDLNTVIRASQIKEELRHAFSNAME